MGTLSKEAVESRAVTSIERRLKEEARGVRSLERHLSAARRRRNLLIRKLYLAKVPVRHIGRLAGISNPAVCQITADDNRDQEDDRG